MHPGDRALVSDITRCPKFRVVCPSRESYNDLVMLGDDGGGRIDEFVKDGSAFGRLIARAQSVCQDLVERTGDECQL